MTEQEVVHYATHQGYLSPLSSAQRAWLLAQLGAGRRLPQDTSDGQLCRALMVRWSEEAIRPHRSIIKAEVDTQQWFDGDAEDQKHLAETELTFWQHIKRMFRRGSDEANA